MTLRAVTDLDDAQLVELVVDSGGKPFQARQIAHWLYRHGVRTWDECRNVGTDLRSALAARVPLLSTSIARIDEAQDGTSKILVRLADGEHLEMVLIPEGERNTLCISSQVGCPVACVFCASGLAGVKRNLTRGEIVEQVLHARTLLRAARAPQDLGETGGSNRPDGRVLTNLVVMGMGEPMLNLDNMLPALARLHDPQGVDFGARRVTVSTSGHPDKIRRFADAEPAYNLAISLHAADDELRRRLVPTARHSVAELVAAARDYFERKHREVTFEVVLLAGINDREQDARSLCDALASTPGTVNLIPWNPVEEIPDLARPGDAAVDRFAGLLRHGGLKVTVRRQRGADRHAACGQLRLRQLAAPS